MKEIFCMYNNVTQYKEIKNAFNECKCIPLVEEKDDEDEEVSL